MDEVINRTVAELAVDEGWRESPYRDHLGYLTIGYGFLIDERKPVKLPKKVGEFWLQVLAEEVLADLVKALPWLKDQPTDVQSALLNMSYQMGIAGVLRFKKMLLALQKGDRKQAATEAEDSTWFKQTPVRAKRIIKLIRG